MSKYLINKYLSPATATYKRYIVRKRINQNSTRSNRQAIVDARLQVDDMPPTEQIYNITGDEAIFCFLILRHIHGNTVYSNLTGQFPIQSYTGMNYIFVCYVYKLNTVLLRTIKSRKTKDMLQAFESIYDELKENATSQHYISSTMNFQGPSRDSSAKRILTSKSLKPITMLFATEPAIKSAKYHTIAHLATIDPNCPIQL